MKKIITGIVLSLIVFVVSAQQKQIDSLKQLLNNVHSDTSRVNVLVELSKQYYLSKIDSGLSYASQALAIAKKTGNKQGEVHALSQVGFSIWLLGNRPAALQTFISSLNMARELNDQWSIARNYDGMSCVYSEQGEYKTAIEYCLKSEAIFRQVKDYSNVVDELTDMADFYRAAGKSDSSLFAARRALQLSVKINEFRWRSQILELIGMAYFQLNKSKIGMDYLHKSFAIAVQKNQPYNLIAVCMPLAVAYHQLGKQDSSIYFAKKAFDVAHSDSFGLGMSDASKLLAQLYYGKDDHEAAQYYKLASTLQDSLFNDQRAKQVLIINIAEQQHEADLKNAAVAYQNKLKLYAILTVLGLSVVILMILLRNNSKQKKANRLLSTQKQQIQQTLHELKSTQVQLIQSEKMASLGELTAGIAHEIQNPLNFVNNFSEVNTELIGEMKQEIEKGDLEEVKLIAIDIEENSKKISMHGKRADTIVKGMLQHSQSRTGTKEPTNINAITDEFMRLAYHGLRAKDKSFNAGMITHFDEKLPNLNVIAQDIGRVLLNLFNNAFYAVNQKQKSAATDYEPEVSVTTFLENGQVVIKVKDNGVGMSDQVKEKSMQPFFTTKPTGEGTGLGLSLTYDIVVKGHGGKIEVITKEGEFSEFDVYLPLQS